MKNKIKTESVAEFISRGGKVTVIPTKKHKPLSRKAMGYRKEVEVEIEPDFSQLPMALKIKYGFRDGK